MLIKLEDLLPNPYRDTERYPVDQDKVDRIKRSIEENGFWDNLIARPHNTLEGKYELGYGFHRLTALRALGVEEIDVSVKILSDYQMLRVLVDENEEFNHTRTVKYINENVGAAKKYIEDHITSRDAEYDNLDDWCKHLFDGEQGFNRSMGQNKADNIIRFTVGWQIISNFLGDSWTRSQIQFALLHIPKSNKPAKVSRKAVEQFTIPGQGATVDRVLTTIEAQFAFPTHEDQEKVVKEMRNDYAKETSQENTPSLKISDSIIEARLEAKVEEVLGYKMSGRDSKTECFAKETDEERPTTILNNRRYFRKVLRGFNTYTTSPENIPMYARHIAFEDFNTLHLLAGDIISRLAEYEKLFGFVSTVDSVVYDFYNDVEIEDKSIPRIGNENEDISSESISVEKWLSQDAAWEKAKESFNNVESNNGFSNILDTYLKNKVEK